MYIQSGELVTISRGRFRIKNKFLCSLRFRIILIIVVVGIIPCFLLRGGILKTYESRAVSLRTADIQSQCTILCNQLASYNYLNNPVSEVIDAELTQLSNVYSGRVMIVDKTMHIIKDTYGLDEGKTIISQNVIKGYQGKNTNYYDKKNGYIEVAMPITEVDSGKTAGVMLVSVSTNSIEDSLDVLRTRGDAILGLLSVLVVVIAVVSAVILVRPFLRITKLIEAVTEGYEDVEIEENAYTETAELSETFNKMMGRLKRLDDSRQEFVSNVSHELKTPLTSMKVLADSLLDQEDVPIEIYKEFMSDITEEIERENEIITDLLTLVKMDKTAPDLSIQPVNVNDLLELILKRLKPIAAKKNVELVFESFRTVTAEIDEVKLTLAFSNLVENAIKYNHEEGWVHVFLNADHKFFYVKVEDSGMGIPEEEHDHIFERFYRVEKSHSKEIGGTGLGLAITRNAVIMHRGSIKVENNVPEGTVFTVRIPLTYIV